MTSPNQYHLQGDGIAVSYYPDGSGPPVAGRGRLRLVYQDTHQAQSFYDNDLRTVAVPDLGRHTAGDSTGLSGRREPHATRRAAEIAAA